MFYHVLAWFYHVLSCFSMVLSCFIMVLLWFCVFFDPKHDKTDSLAVSTRGRLGCDHGWLLRETNHPCSAGHFGDVGLVAPSLLWPQSGLQHLMRPGCDSCWDLIYLHDAEKPMKILDVPRCFDDNFWICNHPKSFDNQFGVWARNNCG